MALVCQPALATAPAWLTSSPVTPGPCVQEFIQMICRTGGNVPCEALRREAAREPVQLAEQEAACRKARANPIFLGRTQMALTLADRLLGNGKPLTPSLADGNAPAFHPDEEIEFDLRPDSFNASEVYNPELEVCGPHPHRAPLFRSRLSRPHRSFLRPSWRIQTCSRRCSRPRLGSGMRRGSGGGLRHRSSKCRCWRACRPSGPPRWIGAASLRRRRRCSLSGS